MVVYKGKHTWNNFKRKVREMSDEQKREFLKELQTDLLTARTRANIGLNHDDVRLLRKKVACVKTILHVPGFHYDPRGGKQ